MRTLTEITNATRRGENVTFEELRYAVCAYDVMFASSYPSQHRPLLEEFFKAAESDPREYIGWDNDPENPDVVDWHQSQINMTPIMDRAKQLLQKPTQPISNVGLNDLKTAWDHWDGCSETIIEGVSGEDIHEELNRRGEGAHCAV